MTLKCLTIGESARTSLETIDDVLAHQDRREGLVAAIQAFADCLNIGYDAYYRESTVSMASHQLV